MSVFHRSFGWGALALLAAGIVAAPAKAQSLDLSTAGGVTWMVKDYGTDGVDVAPAGKDFNGATTANGWSAAEVPADLNASSQVAENVYFWMVAQGIKIPSDFPKDRYLILTD